MEFIYRGKLLLKGNMHNPNCMKVPLAGIITFPSHEE